jgi:DNA-binding GntR family transcriptional regulator
VSLADKVHNARAILRDLRKPDIGEEIWARFSQPKDRQLWYYRSLADVFSKKLRGQLSNELREIVEVLDAGDEEATPAAVRKRLRRTGDTSKHKRPSS